MQKGTTQYNTLTGQHDLVKAIQANDQSVLRTIYTQNFHKVEQYVLKNKGDEQQAKDIYQEAYLAFWQNIKAGKFTARNESALNGYLFQIARNKWLDYLRSPQYRKTTSVEAIVHTDGQAAQTEYEETQDPRMTKTLQAFAHLGDACKTLLTKFYYDKKSLNEIAEELTLDPASARNKKYRCMQRLRKLALAK